MRNIGSRIPTVIFLVVLAFPLLNSNLHLFQFEQKDENRVFKTLPQADIKQLDKFPRAFDEYYNDNFSFRTPLLDLLHKWKYYGFKVSPHPDQTVIGKDGWNFLADKEKRVYEGEVKFTESQLDTLNKLWKRRMDYFAERNIKCYWLIAPTKHRIYPEMLPDNFVKGQPSRIDQLKQYFSDKFPGLIVDPVDPLLKAKKDHKLFYQLDNHWDFNAGFVASQYLLNIIKKDFPTTIVPSYTDYVWKDTVTSFGIHKNVLGIPSLCENEQVVYDKKESAIKAYNYNFPVIEGFAYPWEYEHRYINYQADSTLPRVLVIRDSFCSQMIPFLKEGFKETEFIFDAWGYTVNGSIIQDVHPDIIIFESLETHIEGMIEKNNLW